MQACGLGQRGELSTRELASLDLAMAASVCDAQALKGNFPLTDNVHNDIELSPKAKKDTSSYEAIKPRLSMSRNYKVDVTITGETRKRDSPGVNVIQKHNLRIVGLADWFFYSDLHRQDIRGVGIISNSPERLFTYLAIIRKEREIQGLPRVDIFGFLMAKHCYQFASIRTDGTVWLSDTLMTSSEGHLIFVLQILASFLQNTLFHTPEPNEVPAKFSPFEIKCNSPCIESTVLQPIMLRPWRL